MTSQLDPHCIGQAVSFSTSVPTCKRCACNVACAEKVMTRLIDINERLDVTDMLAATQSFLDKNGVKTEAIKEGGKVRFATSVSVKFDVDLSLVNCGIRAKKIANSILKKGIDIKADIARGENKLHSVKPSYLASIQDHIQQNKSITHEEVKQIIRTHNPSNRDTAISNSASWTVQALTAIGVIEKIGEKYVITY